jgi:RNA-directed DNA polymerase
MGELKPPGKPFDISKQEVRDAWEKVKANKGAPGVDGVTLAEFEADLKNNLHKIWNRMTNGCTPGPRPAWRGTSWAGPPRAATAGG